MRVKVFLNLGLISLMTLGALGCATTHHFAKICPDFKQKICEVKKIGLLSPISYGTNREYKEDVLENALIFAMQHNSPYQLKVVCQKNYSGQWTSSMQQISQDSQKLLREIELEKLWKDRKNEILARKFTEDIKLFKMLDPELDALLITKCEQHYGNAATAGLYAFGALGGIIAAVSAEKDPVIGSHAPADNDTYGSALLVDLATADILWYNFALRYGLDVTKEKHAKEMATEMLYGLLNEEASKTAKVN